MNADAPFDEANDVLVAAERWMGEGRELAIATIIAAEGEAGLLAGRRMIIDASGAVFGGFGHCEIDKAAAMRASAVIMAGEPQLLDLPLPDGHARLYVERLG